MSEQCNNKNVHRDTIGGYIYGHIYVSQTGLSTDTVNQHLMNAPVKGGLHNNKEQDDNGLGNKYDHISDHRLPQPPLKC